MKFLRRYYSELFSIFIFFPLVVVGTYLGDLAGIGIAGLLVFFSASLFRNYQITAFSLLSLLPFLVFQDAIFFLGTGKVFSSLLISLLFYLFCFSIFNKRDWIWMWYVVLWFWGFELFNTISVDMLKNGIAFVAFYGIAYIYLRLIVDNNHKKATMPHFFSLLFSVLLFEFFLVIRVLPLGGLLGPVCVLLLFYFFTHLYRGYLLEKPFRYYIRPGAFTFLLLVGILLIAIKKPF